MARIRTIKPEFFTHWELFDLENESGLPIRVAFAGLWTQADREGRFQWIPQQLKLGCLPYDDIDFSRVLHALTTRGFIKKYTVKGRDFGFIPGFLDHQVINNREKPSSLPDPSNDEGLTRGARVDDASPTREVHAQAEGKGREGKGKEDKSILSGKGEFDGNHPTKDNDTPPPLDLIPVGENQAPRNLRSEAKKILEFLNEKTGRNYRDVDANLDFITARLKEGYSPDELRQVIVRKARQWKGDESMDQYLRPKTLFSKTNMAQYSGELTTEEVQL